MRKNFVLRGALVLLLLLMLLPQAGYAQEKEKPSVWFLSYSDYGSMLIISTAMADVLEAYGFIDPTDRPEARVFQQLGATENSTIEHNSSNASQQLDLVRGMVAAALDNEPDVLVTVSAPVTLAAIQATQDLPNPPAIFFADVYNVYDTGIAQADCIKPAHVAGVETVTHYDQIVDLLLLQDPDIRSVGTIHDSSDAAGIYGAGQIAELGEARGLTVEQTAVNSLADLPLAMNGLVSKGIEAILLPFDDTLLAGMPIVANIANDEGIPVFSAIINGIWTGATVVAGPYQIYEQGEWIGAMIAAYLNGELDVASTAVSRQTVDALGVVVNNLAADMLELEVSDALKERADATISMFGDQALMMPSSELGMMEAQQILNQPQVDLADRQAKDRAYLDSLHCSAEMIAAQQAELEAMEG